ncbi:IclR family transcriptional regulator [Polaromonas sp. JS666]|uniref:IclR family transcriptional regulator n=1 Tax=Polaromonas sp. (strain JS666 / ATCC BAA-500) TaxID=296591 RepID=UPI000891911A|nr:helix-turn-helix domain-containing protein [Polaromonas sp. JS666]SDO12154.1 DNA-binding transcriptional regulator, IclR family [Polaromonas sp. JS666]
MSNIEPTAKDGIRVTALERGLRLLMALRYDEGKKLSDLARATDLDKATASRLLRSLALFSFVLKDEQDRYRLGPAIAVLERTGNSTQGIAPVVQPTLERWAEKTGETASFFVPHGELRLCVAVASGQHAVSHVLNVGDTLATQRGASGRVIRMFAAGRPEANVELLQTSIGERDPELAAVAFPVFTGQNRLLGALSLSGTCTRFSSQSHLQTLQQAVAQAAGEIEGLLLGQ